MRQSLPVFRQLVRRAAAFRGALIALQARSTKLSTTFFSPAINGNRVAPLLSVSDNRPDARLR
jgi:hypothetical protein